MSAHDDGTVTVRKARKRAPGRDASDYWGRHPDSPIAAACSDVGAVRVTDSLRADISHRVSTTDLRRAYTLGVISASGGLAADQHQHASGLWADLSPADYLAEWISTACAWSVSGGATVAAEPVDPDREAEYRCGQVDTWAAELVQVGPVWYVEWLGRTVHPPKWEYLIELGAWQWLGAAAPAERGDAWSGKVLRQWASRVRRGDGATVAPMVECETF